MRTASWPGEGFIYLMAKGTGVCIQVGQTPPPHKCGQINMSTHITLPYICLGSVKANLISSMKNTNVRIAKDLQYRHV